jgi:hypothetical protein
MQFFAQIGKKSSTVCPANSAPAAMRQTGMVKGLENPGHLMVRNAPATKQRTNLVNKCARLCAFSKLRARKLLNLSCLFLASKLQ